jgi:hypothetical protein
MVPQLMDREHQCDKRDDDNEREAEPVRVATGVFRKPRDGMRSGYTHGDIDSGTDTGQVHRCAFYGCVFEAANKGLVANSFAAGLQQCQSVQRSAGLAVSGSITSNGFPLRLAGTSSPKSFDKLRRCGGRLRDHGPLRTPGLRPLTAI